jgi:two-component SAPR family response regulator
MVEPEGPQITSQYGAYALHAGQTKLDAHTCEHTDRQICNICCFSTTTMIRERASILRYTYVASNV